MEHKRDVWNDVSLAMNAMVNTKEYKIYLFTLISSIFMLWCSLLISSQNVPIAICVAAIGAILLGCVIMALSVLILAQLIVLEKDVTLLKLDIDTLQKLLREMEVNK